MVRRRVQMPSEEVSVDLLVDLPYLTTLKRMLELAQNPALARITMVTMKFIYEGGVTVNVPAIVTGSRYATEEEK